jgi:hypothetical protein
MLKPTPTRRRHRHPETTDMTMTNETTNKFAGCLLCGEARRPGGYMLCETHWQRWRAEDVTPWTAHVRACCDAWYRGERSPWPRPFVEEAPVMAVDANGYPVACLNCGDRCKHYSRFCESCYDGLDGKQFHEFMAAWAAGARDFPRRVWAKPAAQPPRVTVAPRRKAIDPARPETFVGTRWRGRSSGTPFTVVGVEHEGGWLVRVYDGDSRNTMGNDTPSNFADRLDDAPEAATPPGLTSPIAREMAKAPAPTPPAPAKPSPPPAPTLGTCGAGTGNVHTRSDVLADAYGRGRCALGLSCPTHGVREREPWRSSVDDWDLLPDVDVRR